MSRRRFFRAMDIFWLMSICSCLVLFGGWSGAQAKVMEIGQKKYDIAQPGEFIPGEVAVKVRPGITVRNAHDLATQVQGRIKAMIPQYDLYLIQLPSKTGAAAQQDQLNQAMELLKAHPHVQRVYPNYKFSIPKPIGPAIQEKVVPAPAQKKGSPSPPGAEARTTADTNLLEGNQWHLYRIKYPFAELLPAIAPTVAVIDTGVDYNHPDLYGKVLLGYDFVDDDGDPMDNNGHGTHVAGVIGARQYGGVLGVSPTSQVLAVRVLDRDGAGGWFQVMQGIIYARTYPEVQILNLSLGGYLPLSSPEYLDFQQVIDDTVALGKIVCVAAGNEDNGDLYYNYYYSSGPNMSVPVPAWFPNSFTVAASEETDCRAYDSNYNVGTLTGALGTFTYNFNFVDLVAPGYNILSCYPEGQHVRLSGTSFCTAITSGAAARVWAQYPSFTASQVQNNLINNGKILGQSCGFPYYPTPQRRVDLSKSLGLNETGLMGVVYGGQDGRPLKWVRVTASAPGGNTVVGWTNQDGFFILTGLTGGKDYNLMFYKTGCTTLNFGAAYWTTKTTTGRIEDVYVPVFLNQARPDGQWNLLLTWHSLQYGYNEAVNTYPSAPVWWPINWDETTGAYFGTRLSQDGSAILDPSNRGTLNAPPYAAITHEAWDFMRPSCNVALKPQGGSVYRIWTMLDNHNDTWYEWGKYNRPGVYARAFLYYGPSTKAIIKAANATGTGPIWRIADIYPGGTVVVINEFANTPF